MTKQRLLDNVQNRWQSARDEYVQVIRACAASPSDDNFALVDKLERDLDRLAILRFKVESQVPEDADIG